MYLQTGPAGGFIPLPKADDIPYPGAGYDRAEERRRAFEARQESFKINFAPPTPIIPTFEKKFPFLSDDKDDKYPFL